MPGDGGERGSVSLLPGEPGSRLRDNREKVKLKINQPGLWPSTALSFLISAPPAQSLGEK